MDEAEQVSSSPVQDRNRSWEATQGIVFSEVANLWTKFTASDCYAMGANVKKCKILSKTLVAATSSKAKTYVLARLKIRDREVGGSNPLAPTILKYKATITCGRHLWQPHFLCVANLWTKFS